MNRSLIDVAGAALVVSQFTLYADVRRGNRPGFTDAAPPDVGAALVDAFGEELRARRARRRGAVRRSHARRLVNDGPVTIWLDWPPA